MLPEHETPMPSQIEFRTLMKEANDGLPGGIEKLRECLAAHPAIYERLGDMSQMALESLIAAAAGENKALAESLRLCLETMRQELLGEAPTRIERIAVERILVAHLEANHLTAQYPSSAGSTLKQQNAIASQKSAAERRLQNAMKSLLTIQSLTASLRAAGGGRLRVFQPASG